MGRLRWSAGSARPRPSRHRRDVRRRGAAAGGALIAGGALGGGAGWPTCTTLPSLTGGGPVGAARIPRPARACRSGTAADTTVVSGSRGTAGPVDERARGVPDADLHVVAARRHVPGQLRRQGQGVPGVGHDPRDAGRPGFATEQCGTAGTYYRPTPSLVRSRRSTAGWSGGIFIPSGSPTASPTLRRPRRHPQRRSLCTSIRTTRRDAVRAHPSGGYTFVERLDQGMGLYNVFTTHGLRQTGANYYVVADTACEAPRRPSCARTGSPRAQDPGQHPLVARRPPRRVRPPPPSTRCPAPAGGSGGAAPASAAENSALVTGSGPVRLTGPEGDAAATRVNVTAASQSGTDIHGRYCRLPSRPPANGA